MRKKKIIALCLICVSLTLTACSNGTKKQDTLISENNKENVLLDRAYITRFSDVNEITYPKFVFNYPSNWKVVNESVDEFGESVTIRNEDGNEILYTHMNVADNVNLSTSASTMLKVDVSEISDSKFNPSYVQANDYSDLGGFMVSKLHVVGQLDMQVDSDFEEIDGSVSYALLPQSMSGIKDDVRGPFNSEFYFNYGGRISMVCTPETQLNEEEEYEVVEILKSFRTLEDAEETYTNTNTENALTLSKFLNNEEPILMYYLNFDNLYNREEIMLDTKVDTLAQILVFESKKVNQVFITATFENWDSLTVKDILSLEYKDIIHYLDTGEHTSGEYNYIIAGNTIENKSILENEVVWIGHDNVSAMAIPEFEAPIELDLGDDYFAGFWNSDSRGSQVMIFKTEKDKYFTFDDQKDIIINLTKDDILKKENK